MKYIYFVLISALLIYPLSTQKIIAANSYSSSKVVVSGTHTSIKVESNGQIKTYESDSPGSVTVQTDDGSAKAMATVNDVDSTSTVKPSITPQAKKLTGIPTFKISGTAAISITPLTETVKNNESLSNSNDSTRLNVYQKFLFFIRKLFGLTD
jgi:hypothetical protein